MMPCIYEQGKGSCSLLVSGARVGPEVTGARKWWLRKFRGVYVNEDPWIGNKVVS